MTNAPCVPPQSPVLAQLDRPVVLVGLMGAGKTRVGGMLARALEIPFVDSDMEIERAAGMAVADIFDVYGESAFRDCEVKVLARLVEAPVKVLATGGGSFMNADTRALIKEKAISIWLKAELDVLLERVMQGGRRPLLKVADPRAVLQELIDKRYPIYAEADLVVDSGTQSPQDMARTLVEMIGGYLEKAALCKNT